MKKPRKHGLLGLLLLAGLLFFAVVLPALGPGLVPLEDSVASPLPEGRRALLLLLRRIGVDARASTDAPRDLPRGAALVWLPRAPTAKLPTQAQTDRRPVDASRVGLHDLRHYRAFVEGGGTLLLAAGDETKEFLVQALGIEEAAGLALVEADESVQEVRTSGGDLLALSASASGAFAPLPVHGTARALWTVERENSTAPFAVEYPSGAGSVVVLARDQFVENRSIGEHDHALAAVRLVEDLAHGGPVLFSEYELGRYDPPSTLSLLLSPRVLLVTLHAVVILGLFTWMHAFARAFPRDPEPLSQFSPYLRARSLAEVLVRARRRGLLADLLRRGVFGRLQALARVRRRRAEALENGGPALQPVRGEDVTQLVRAAGVADLEPRLAELLLSRGEEDEPSLARLDQELRSLERELERRLHERNAAAAAQTTEAR